MPQCCTDDKQVIFTYDVEDGAPLSAYFFEYDGVTPGFTDAAISAGTGINGSHSITSDYASSNGQYAEGSVEFPTHDDICNNQRREFAVGGYWNGKNVYSLFGFFLFEVRDSLAGPQVLVSVYRVDRDVVVYEAASAVEAYRVRNVFDTVNFPLRKIEARGSISTPTTGLLGNPDGWIEIRVDGKVINDGDDFELFDPDAEPDPCPDGRRAASFGNSQTGWDKVTFGPQGDLDCLYIKEVAAYCNDNPILKRPGAKCDPAGPGGALPGPRIIHPGGLTATYTAPTSGGGVPATASDPVDPQSIVGATSVLYSLDLTLCDSTVLSVGQEPIVCSGRRYVQPLVVRFGAVEYPLSDRAQGTFRGQVWEVDIADPDGTLRGYLDSSTNRFFKRWQGQLFAESDTARLAGTARLPQARGRCVSATMPDDLVVRLTFADELTRQDSPSTLDAEVPRFTIGDVFHGPATTATGLTFLATSAPRDDKDSVSQPPANVLAQPLPCLLGECSDDWRIAENPPVTPIGICTPYLLGDVLLNNGSETWQCYLASQYAIKDISSMFGSNLNTDCPGSVRLDLDALTDQFLIPNKGNWSSYFATNYIDFTWGPQQYRCTVFFARGPISLQHVDGIVPLSFNALGIEATGDSTGNFFDDLAYMTQWFLDHPVIQHTLTGNWNAVATFSDGVAKLRTSSFAAVKAIHDVRLSTRYRGRLIIDTKRSARDWLAALLVSGHMRAGINHHGQMFVTTLDETQSLAALTAFNDQNHIQDGSFRITSERSGELENSVTYDWGPEPATGRVTGDLKTYNDAESQANWDEVAKAQEIHYLATGRQDVADDVTSRRIAQTKNGITLGEVTIDLAGTALLSGGLMRVTDFRGLGTTGWTQRVLAIEGRVLNPNVSDPPQANDLTMLVRWEDQQRSLVAPSGLFGGGVLSDGTTTSVVGFLPLGSSSASPTTGWVLGSSAAGTGWRLG